MNSELAVSRERLQPRVRPPGGQPLIWMRECSEVGKTGVGERKIAWRQSARGVRWRGWWRGECAMSQFGVPSHLPPDEQQDLFLIVDAVTFCCVDGAWSVDVSFGVHAWVTCGGMRFVCA